MRPRDREAERPIRETEDKGRRREYDENGTKGVEGDKAIEEEEVEVVVEKEGGLTVPRGATCLMN